MSELKGKNPAEITGLIKRHKGHIVIEAGAGTGKTFSLTERVIHQLTEQKVPLERMLALTFTDFAAAEMRSRIYEALNRKLHELHEHAISADNLISPESVTGNARQRNATEVRAIMEHLQTARRRFSRNQISTFHSFCNRILQNFPDEITEISVQNRPEFNDGNVADEPKTVFLEGSFELLSDYDEVLWMLEWKKSFYKMYKDHPGLQRQLSRLSASDFESFMKRLAGLSESVLYEMSELTPAEYVSMLKRLAEAWNRELESLTASLLELFASHPEWFKNSGNIPRTFSELLKHKIKNGLSKKIFDLTETGLDTYEEVCTLGKEMFGLHTELEKIAPYISNPDTIRSLSEYPESGANFFDANHEAYWNMRNLAELALRWGTLIRFKRFEAGYFNYDDMIWLTHKLFDENPAVTAQMSSRFDQILVDEFQDTDRRQWDIIRKLGFGDISDKSARAADKEVLIVGDVKQAIYAFRGGDVAMMGQAGRDMKQFSAGPDGLPLKVVPLSYSFRSNRVIIQFVNRLFRHVFSGREEAASYEAHHQPIDAPPPELSKNVTAVGEIRVLYSDIRKLREEHAEFSIPAETLADDVLLLEARRIARFLREIHDGKQELYSTLTKKMQKGEKTIGVLYRRRTQMHQLEQALIEVDLPFTVAKGVHFYQRREIIDAWLLLSFLLDAYDDVSLVGLLRSPVVSLSDSGLLAVRMVMDEDDRKYPNYWSAISNFLSWKDGMLSEADQIALQSAIPFLKKLRENVPGSRVSELLEQAFFIYGPYLGESAGNSRVRENLVKLLDVIRSLEGSGRGTLFEITEFLSNRIREEAQDSESEQPDPAPIQLMTIHGSKGLQFPMVVIPDMYAGPNDGGLQLYIARDDSDSLIYPAIAYKTANREGVEDAEASFLYHILKAERRKREIAETKRLFYVAMTRAETHLLLSIAKSAGSGTRGTFASFLEPLLRDEHPDNYEDIRMDDLTPQELEKLSLAGTGSRNGGGQWRSHFTDNNGDSSAKPRIPDRNHPVMLSAVQAVSTEMITASGLHLEKHDVHEMANTMNPVSRLHNPPIQWTGLEPADAGTLIHRTLEFGFEVKPFVRRTGMPGNLSAINSGHGRLDMFWRRELLRMNYPDPDLVINRNRSELTRHCLNAIHEINRLFGMGATRRFETAFEWTTRSVPGLPENADTSEDQSSATDETADTAGVSSVESAEEQPTKRHYHSGATVTLRGSIDIIIRDPDGLEHIIDIKTGPVDTGIPDGKPVDLSDFREHAKAFGYDRQIRAYQQAYEALTGTKIPSSRIWLLFTAPEGGRAIPLSGLTG